MVRSPMKYYCLIFIEINVSISMLCLWFPSRAILGNFSFSLRTLNEHSIYLSFFSILSEQADFFYNLFSFSLPDSLATGFGYPCTKLTQLGDFCVSFLTKSIFVHNS